VSKYNYTQGTFSGKGNIEIAFQGWAVDRPKAVVVVVHGLGEHSGRYMNIIETMAGKGISFFGLDHRGHGRSQGIRGHIDSFMDYIIDLKTFVNMVHEAHKDTPVIMLGHSLGGAIACRYALTYQNDIDGLILSSAALMPAVKIPAIKRMAGVVLSKIFPTVNMANELDSIYLSHDENVVKAYNEDPLVHGLVTPRFFTEFTANGQFCLDHASQLRLPLLIFHGTGDRFCNIKGSEFVYERSLSEDKKFEVFPDLYHETMNETVKEKAKVLAVVSKWMLAHISAKKVSKANTGKEVKKPAGKTVKKTKVSKIPAKKTVKAKKPGAGKK